MEKCLSPCKVVTMRIFENNNFTYENRPIGSTAKSRCLISRGRGDELNRADDQRFDGRSKGNDFPNRRDSRGPIKLMHTVNERPYRNTAIELEDGVFCSIVSWDWFWSGTRRTRRTGHAYTYTRIPSRRPVKRSRTPLSEAIRKRFIRIVGRVRTRTRRSVNCIVSSRRSGSAGNGNDVWVGDTVYLSTARASTLYVSRVRHVIMNMFSADNDNNSDNNARTDTRGKYVLESTEHRRADVSNANIIALVVV